VKTYARKGQTPVLRAKLSREHLSVISAITQDGKLYTTIRSKAFDTAAVCRFLDHLQQQIAGQLLLIWDGAPIHRSQILKDYLARCDPNRLQIVRLPGYAPELNPGEGVWHHLKQQLKNVCCHNLEQLRDELRKAIKRLRQRAYIIQACFRQAEKL
jgi:transposase